MSDYVKIWNTGSKAALQLALKVLDEAETLDEARTRIRYLLEATATLGD
jgi:hypothetical protein